MTCTLGEVKNRADLVVYWGGNPAECHPRHFTKYALMPKGRFVPNGRKDRTMVLVDIRETPSVRAAKCHTLAVIPTERPRAVISLFGVDAVFEPVIELGSERGLLTPHHFLTEVDPSSWTVWRLG